MNHCKTCRHWVKELPKRRRSYTAEEIMYPVDPDTFEPMEDLSIEVRICDSPLMSFFERPVDSCGATIIDGSQYFALLLTAEDFGCVNHQENMSNA